LPELLIRLKAHQRQQIAQWRALTDQVPTAAAAWVEVNNGWWF
jgi:hypothetical protein